MKISNILNMPVLSVYEGELIGQVSKLYFDKKLKKVSHFIITSEEGINYCLLPKNIYKHGKNAITIKNSTVLTLDFSEDLTDYLPQPLEYKTYTIQGEYLGKIASVSLDEKYNVSEIDLDNEKILDHKYLASCGKNTIIVYDENTTVDISKFKRLLAPKLFKTKQETAVSTQPVVTETNSEIADVKTDIKNNPKFLLGRLSTKDIMLDEDKLLIKANSTITARTISLAYSNNKIKELLIYSRVK